MSGMLHAIAELIRNPGSNLVASAIGLAAVALLLIVLLVAALLWAMGGGEPEPRQEKSSAESGEGGDDSESREEATPAAPNRLRRLLSPALAVLLIASAVTGYVSTSSNQYCASTCHQMTKPADAWRNSTHARVPCIRCHEGRFGISWMSGNLSRLACMLAAFGSPAKPGSIVPPERCLDCHSDIMSRTVKTKRGVLVEHRRAVTAGAPCALCHLAAGHATKTPTSSMMPKCSRCHNGTSAHAKCGTCHTVDIGKTAIMIRPVSRIETPVRVACSECH